MSSVVPWLVEQLTGFCQQQEFAAAVGIAPPRVSTLISEGHLPPDGTAGQWLLAYCARLREQAAGRTMELSAERAALAREQRIGQALKNAVAQGEYGPVGLLADVLAQASAAVAQRFDALPGELRRACPDLSDLQLEQLARTLSSARNEWVRSTAALVDRRLAEIAADGDDDDGAVTEDDDGTELDGVPA
jgi:phage terminase Nu1 subunit (DNA packaging protein)